MAVRNNLTQEELKTAYFYDAETGLFYKRNKKGISKKPTISSNDHYRHIKIDDVKYKQHRMAWLYMYGTIPPVVDHINGDRKDNRISNLRAANNKTNSWNRKNIGTLPYKGVSISGGKYRCRITYKCIVSQKVKTKTIGRFQSAVEAALHYDLHASLLFENFAKLNFPHLKGRLESFLK